MCYRNHGYPPSWGNVRGNAYANNVGSDVQEVGVEMKMKEDEGNMSFTNDQSNVLIALLKRNNVDGIKHATNIAGKHSNHDVKQKLMIANRS